MIYGKTTRLRAIERDDIPTFVRWFNDPEVRQYLTIFAPPSTAQEERWVESLLNRTDDYVYAIEARIDGGWLHIGNVGLHAVDWKNRVATFGIALGEKAQWGQGFGTDATRTMVRFAFDELNLHRVELEVYAFNHRAIRCYEKAGFQREGTRRQRLFHQGRYHDAYWMAILQDEFQDDP